MGYAVPSPPMSQPDSKVYTLLALSQSIRNLIQEKIGNRLFGLKAEIAQIKQAASGHWYLELVQERDGNRLASIQAVIWALDYEQILAKHGPEVSQLLKAGQELVMQVQVDYHPVYGLKLLIKDLDLSFMLGELEKRKRQTLERLKVEGLLDQQKELSPKMVFQNIAVLSSAEAAAYQDFVQHLKENEFGYRLQTDLYPVPVQGSGAASQISARLKQIPYEHYDLIVLIRGGGSKLDLDAFNDEELCRTVAEIPIPVHTGIGHESDWTVIDLTAQKAHKTPTALADYLLDKMAAFEGDLQQLAELLQHKCKDLIKLEDQILLSFREKLQLLPLSQIRRQRGEIHLSGGALVRLSAQGLRENERILERYQSQLKEQAPALIRRQREKLQDLNLQLSRDGEQQLQRIQKDLLNLSERLDLLRPERTLERGYSITRKGTKSLKTVEGLIEGDLLQTQLHDGQLESKIVKILKNE